MHKTPPHTPYLLFLVEHDLANGCLCVVVVLSDVLSGVDLHTMNRIRYAMNENIIY